MAGDCPGCSGNNVDLNLTDEEYMEKLNKSMEGTKEILSNMQSTVEGLNINANMFDGLESQIKQINNYLSSGEFFSNIDKMLKSYAQVRPDAMQSMAQMYATNQTTDLDKMIETLNALKASKANNSTDSTSTE